MGTIIPLNTCSNIQQFRGALHQLSEMSSQVVNITVRDQGTELAYRVIANQHIRPIFHSGTKAAISNFISKNRLFITALTLAEAQNLIKIPGVKREHLPANVCLHCSNGVVTAHRVFLTRIPFFDNTTFDRLNKADGSMINVDFCQEGDKETFKFLVDFLHDGAESLRFLELEQLTNLYDLAHIFDLDDLRAAIGDKFLRSGVSDFFSFLMAVIQFDDGKLLTYFHKSNTNIDQIEYVIKSAPADAAKVFYEQLLAMVVKEPKNSCALFFLGYCYQQGVGTPKDLQKAFYQFELSANEGNSCAQNSLAVCYKNGLGVEKDEREAALFFRLSAKQGNSYGQYYLGTCYRDGIGVEKNDRRAVELYRAAAEQGNAAAQVSLGTCYFEGVGVEKNENIAAEFYCAAVQQGNAYGQYALGFCYLYGKGVEKNERKAIELYRVAAEQGVSLAQQDLGYCYLAGIGINKDFKKACDLFLLAANQGLSKGQNSLGHCYLHGLGVERNAQKAVELFRLSAAQGDFIAQCNLACCYERGIGVVKNLQEALKFYRLSAAQEYTPSRRALARLGF